MAKNSRQRRQKQAAVEKELTLLNQLITLQAENAALKQALEDVISLVTPENTHFNPACQRAAALLASYEANPYDCRPDHNDD